MIQCKNCSSQISEDDAFCKKCGAQVINNRISIKQLWSNLLNALGWDSKFFITLRHLIYKPQHLLEEYINGTRNKYANPFTFFAITIAISLFTFSQYSEELSQMFTTISSMPQTENIGEIDSLEIFGHENGDELMQAFLKYYNIFAFLLLPIYTLIAFLVFGKPYNFGEHLVINTYLQSLTILLSVLLFGISLLLQINIYAAGIYIATFLYYCFAYKTLYKLTFGRLLLKILKFIGLSLLIIILMVLIGIISAVLEGNN